MRGFFELLAQQRSTIAIGLAVFMIGVLVVLRYAYNLWWPWGIGLATALGVAGIIMSLNDDKPT